MSADCESLYDLCYNKICKSRILLCRLPAEFAKSIYEDLFDDVMFELCRAMRSRKNHLDFIAASTGYIVKNILHTTNELHICYFMNDRFVHHKHLNNKIGKIPMVQIAE